MALTPMDIHNVDFAKSFRGYSVEEVDEFLERVAKDYESLSKENMELKDQIEQLKEKNQSYQKLEETMHNAIMVAQEAAEEVKSNANREAELIRKEAEKEAQRIVEDARYRASRIVTEHEEIYKQVQIFKMRFRSFMESQLSALEMEDWMEPSSYSQDQDEEEGENEEAYTEE